MALVFHSGLEIGDLGEWASTGGTFSIDSNIKNTGSFSIRVNPTNGNGYITNSINRARVSFYLYIAIAPNGDAPIAGRRLSAGFWGLFLTSARKLELWDDGGENTNGNTILDTETWYRISMSVDSSGNCKVYVNGSEEISASDVSSIHGRETVGLSAGTFTADLYFDDFASDDTDSTNDLGDIRVVRASLKGDGTNTDFDTRVPANGRPYFGLVDECPASDDDYVYLANAGIDSEETYDLQECSGLGIGASDTIEAVSIWCRMDKGGGKTSTHQLVVYDEANYEYTVTFSKSFGWKNKYLAARPGDGAWSQDVFDAFEAGAGNAGDGGQDTFLSCVMVMVAFIPSVAPPPVYIPRHSGTVGVLIF